MGLYIYSGMRKGTPQADHQYLITVSGGTKACIQRRGFQAPDAAYLILLDHSGDVRWRYNGLFDEDAHRTLSRQVSASPAWDRRLVG